MISGEGRSKLGEERMEWIVRMLDGVKGRIEQMNKGCIVIDFAGRRMSMKVTEVIEGGPAAGRAGTGL